MSLTASTNITALDTDLPFDEEAIKSGNPEQMADYMRQLVKKTQEALERIALLSITMSGEGALATKDSVDLLTEVTNAGALAFLDTVDTDQIVDTAITEAKLADLAVTLEKVRNMAITGVKLSAGSVTANKIAANAITSVKIAANSIMAKQMAALSIGTDELIANSVTAGKIEALAVETDKLAANAVIASKLYIVGVDSDGKIDLGQIGAGDLDNITDGSTYAKMLATGMFGTIQLLVNGIFDNWAGGASAVPDGWTEDTSPNIAREGTIVKLGTYSIKITRSGTDCGILQQIETERGIDYWKGRSVTFACWVYATVADRAKLRMYDGLGGNYDSTFHTGDSTWQLLTATMAIPANANQLGVRCHVFDGDTDVYFDGAMLVEGSYAMPFACKADVTGDHQGDISLANLDEKSVDSLTDGSTYARMLAAWKHGTDPTKMDLSLGFAASITTAQIGLLAVHTGQINDLAVDTLQIADDAVTIPISAYTDGLVDMGTLTVLQSASITATGQPIQIIANIFADYVGAAGQFKLYIYRDATVIFTQTSAASTGWLGISSGFHTIALQDTPSAASYTYYIKGTKTGGNGPARARHRSMLLLEVKK